MSGEIPDLAIELREFELGYWGAGALNTRVKPIVDGVDLEVPHGQFLILVGPSGGGKSSLLSAFLGIQDPFAPTTYHRGTLKVLGQPVNGSLPTSLRGRVSAVFQGGALLDELSPRENVALAARAAGANASRADDYLARAGLPHPPPQVSALSGGEQKRVALARGLATDPELWILDEPTAGLDPKSASEIATLLRELHDGAARTRTTIVITHDFDAFASTIDGVLLLDRTRGQLEYLTKDDYRPAVDRAEERAHLPSAVPPLAPTSLRAQLGRCLSGALLGVARFGHTATLAVRHAVPKHFGMLGRALTDHVVGPAPYIAGASFAGGAIATYFAIQNNPLEGAFQREILLGTGKVLVGTALPLLVGLLFAARVSAGAAARIGDLRRNRAFDALPLIGVSPPALLLNPLLWSSLIAAVVLTGLGIVFGTVACWLAARSAMPISTFAWATNTFSAVDVSDYRWAFLKAIAAGAVTSLTAYHLATRPMASSRDVAAAANSAIVWSTLGVLIAQGAMTIVQYG